MGEKMNFKMSYKPENIKVFERGKEVFVVTDLEGRPLTMFRPADCCMPVREYLQILDKKAGTRIRRDKTML
jgi:hypothetical protein